MRKIVSGNFRCQRESCGNGVVYVLCTWDASRDRFGVAGILTKDGRRCGSREIFSVANG